MSVSLPQCAAVRSIVSLVCVAAHGGDRGSCREPLIRVRQPSQPTPPCKELAQRVPRSLVPLCTAPSFSFLMNDKGEQIRRCVTSFIPLTARPLPPLPLSAVATSTPPMASPPIEPPFRAGEGGSPWGGDASRLNDEITPVTRYACQPLVPEDYSGLNHCCPIMNHANSANKRLTL